MPHNTISVAAYTRAEVKDQKLHVTVEPRPVGFPAHMCVRLAEMCIYLTVDDARVLAEAMLAELKVAAA